MGEDAAFIISPVICNKKSHACKTCPVSGAYFHVEIQKTIVRCSSSSHIIPKINIHKFWIPNLIPAVFAKAEQPNILDIVQPSCPALLVYKSIIIYLCVRMRLKFLAVIWIIEENLYGRYRHHPLFISILDIVGVYLIGHVSQYCHQVVFFIVEPFSVNLFQESASGRYDYPCYAICAAFSHLRIACQGDFLSICRRKPYHCVWPPIVLSSVQFLSIGCKERIFYALLKRHTGLYRCDDFHRILLVCHIAVAVRGLYVVRYEEREITLRVGNSPLYLSFFSHLLHQDYICASYRYNRRVVRSLERAIFIHSRGQHNNPALKPVLQLLRIGNQHGTHRTSANSGIYAPLVKIVRRA